MNRIFLKWTLRLTALAMLLLGLLIAIVLNPTLLYASKTVMGNYSVYHQKPLDSDFKLRLDEATQIIKASELFDANFKFDVCLNDGSLYPSLMEKLLGRAFALGFYNLVAVCGAANFKDNYVDVNGKKWNLTQLLAHEEVHCLQVHKFGIWNSNPIANNPKWKWEGYPEFVARRNAGQSDLAKNIELLNKSIQKDKDAWGIGLADSTVSP